MKLTEQIVFPPFRLDPVNEQLWREHQLVPLRPKTFAVLAVLGRTRWSVSHERRIAERGVARHPSERGDSERVYSRFA